MNRPVVLVLYTTLYREGGRRLAQVARTLAAERARARSEVEVRLFATETKAAFVAAIDAVARGGGALAELHFVGHSGVYGPMFGTRARPEQLSPYEWRELQIPFAQDGEAFFHACRTARFFAPFFARTHQVPCSGYHWYTAFSREQERFAVMPPWYPEDAPLYAFGMPGRRSHGIKGSAKKHLGLSAREEMKRYLPALPEGDPSYDHVAELYDEAFQDIRVRADEWRYLTRHLPTGRPRVLDVGCGNGALLEALSGRIGESAGVDSSERMLERARRRCAALPNVRFAQVNGPKLPFEDDRFDVVISLLSFRYLDWDPLMQEIGRVLAPGGKLLVVDMVTAKVGLLEWPRALRDAARHRLRRERQPGFRAALSRLVSAPEWADMLRENPIRAEHELCWFLESRFPERRVETLNVGRHNRMLAFDSGRFEEGQLLAENFDGPNPP